MSDVVRTTPSESALDASINGLRNTMPIFSASTTLTRRLRVALITTVAAVVAAFIMWPLPSAVVAMGVAMFMYLANLTDRLYLFTHGIGTSSIIQITDDEARDIPDDELPLYTVLLPAFGEPNIVEALLAGVGMLEYPVDRLDIKLLLEADDYETVTAALASEATEFVEIILVPAAEPRTKPKAALRK